uniref:Uncharacterized protein n=1 Tax=Gossypium raimondii TaxID=29730 RepID=A0A0D2TQT0_GOSRA|nr:hypothetical protein B456_009G156800 [Gossypium raimondii]
MYISVTIKRYRAIKEVGKIKMSVGVIAYYKLVQVCQVNMFSCFKFHVDVPSCYILYIWTCTVHRLLAIFSRLNEIEIVK